MKKLTAILLSLVLFSASVRATEPAISGFTGTPGDGNSLQINGSNFGIKAVAKPYFFADFEQGTLDPNATLGVATTSETSDAIYSTTDKHAGIGSAGSRDSWRFGTPTAFGNGRHFVGTTIPSNLISDGSKLFVSFWRKVTYTVSSSDNWKWFRIWALPDGDNYPNWYVAQPAGGGRLSYIESSCAFTANNHQTSSAGFVFPAPTSTWRQEEYILQLPSSNVASDGIFQILINNSVIDDFRTWGINCASAAGIMRQVQPEDDASNFTPAAGTEIWKDDIVIDLGWSRAYLGNASTYSACTVKEYQPATTWLNGAVTINQRFASFTSGGSKWLYVCNANGECNANGFLLQGSGSPDPCAGISCVSGQHCEVGACVADADPCLGISCGTGFHCDTGNCIADPVIPPVTPNAAVCPCYLP